MEIIYLIIMKMTIGNTKQILNYLSSLKINLGLLLNFIEDPLICANSCNSCL